MFLRNFFEINGKFVPFISVISLWEVALKVKEMFFLPMDILPFSLNNLPN